MNRASGQITVVGSQTNSNANFATIAINRPTSLQAGDLMIANITNRGSASDPTTLPSGWIKVTSYGLATAGRYAYIAYKVAVAADATASSYTFGWGTTAQTGIAGGITAFRGVNTATTGGIEVTGTAAADQTAGPIVPTQIATLSNDAMILFFAQISGTGITFTGNWTVGGNNMTEAYTVSSTVEPSAGLAYLTRATAGATGSGSKAISASARWGGILLALKPLPLPVINSSLTASSTYGSASSYTITATNTPTSFNATGLPSGMSVNTSTGVITVGATTAAGTYNITISTANANGTDSKTLSYTVNKAPLTITGISISNKIFDGNTTATITGTAAYSGLKNGETFTVTGTPTASFADPNVGTGKPVTVTGYTAPSSNYSIIQPAGLTADITASSLTVTAVNDTIRINTTCFVNNNMIEANVLVNDTDPDNNIDRSSVLLINPANPAQTGTSYTVAGTGQWTTNGNTVTFIAASGFIGNAEISYRVCDSSSNCSSAKIVLELGDKDNRGCFPGSVWDVASSDTVLAITSNSGCRNPTFILGTPDYDPADTMTYALLAAANNNVVLDFGATPVTTTTYDSIRIYWASVSTSNSVIRIEHSRDNSIYSALGNDTTNSSDPVTEFCFRVPAAGLRYIRLTFISGAAARIDGAQAEKWSCITSVTDAEADIFTVREDIPSQLNILNNDLISGGSPPEISIVTPPTQGRLSINPDNSVTYLNFTDYPTGVGGSAQNGSDSFTYRICNLYGSCANAKAYVKIINDKCGSSNYRPLGSTPKTLTIIGNNLTIFDSYVKKDKQDENKGASNPLEIGKSKNERRALFKPSNIKAIQDSVTIDGIINSAQLSIYRSGGDGNTLNYSAHKLTRNWTETGSSTTGVTWKRASASSLWTALGGDFDATPSAAISATGVNGFKTFEIASIVQQWTSVITDTFGVLIKQNAIPLVDKRHQFQSSEGTAAQTPRMVINYSLPLPCTAIPNRPPMSNPDYVSLGTEDSVLINPITNDSDPEGNNIILASVSRLNPSNGNVIIYPSYTFSYIPNFSIPAPRTDTLLYKINDGLLFDSAYVFVKIGFRANAGADRPLCSSKDTIRLSGKITGGISSCQWTTSGSGQFSSSTIINPVYTLSSQDRNLSSLSFILTSTSTGSSCNSIGDTINFTIEKQPDVMAGGPDSVCSSATPSAITLAGSSLTNATNGTWSIISGAGSLSSTAAQSNPATISFTPGSGFSGNVQLKLKSNSTSNCPADSAIRNMYIKPNLQILSNPSSQSICPGSNDTLKVTTNVASSTFQWFSSSNNGINWTAMSDGGTYSGTATPSLIFNTPDVTNSTLLFKVRITNPTACLSPAETSPISLKFKNLWLGNNNTSWDNTLNWSDQTLPGSGCTEVCIMGSRPFQPVISNTAAVSNIRIMNGGLLTANGRLRISGNITTEGSGKINAQNGTIELFGNSAAQNIAGSQFSDRRIKNLVINNSSGVNISSASNDTLKLTGILSFGNVNNSVLNTGDNLTITSNQSGTGAVADITNNGTNSGNSITGSVTVERYITQARKWQFLSIPTSTAQTFKQSWMEGAGSMSQNPAPGYGTLITDNRSDWLIRGFDTLSPGGPSVKLYNPLTGNYDPIANTNSPIGSQYGYMAYIRGDRSSTPSNGVRNSTILRTTGPLKQGSQPSISIPDSAFAAIGNPFASAIDMARINKPNCINAIYIWDPALTGSYGVGGYQTFVGFQDTGILYNYYPIPGGGSYPSGLIPFNQIQSGQAFFVRGGINASVIMEESDKMSDSSRQVMRPGPVSFSIIRPSLYSISNHSPLLEDGTAILFSPNFSNEAGMEDAEKMRNGGVNVSVSREPKLYAIEGRKYLEEKDTFFLNVTGLRQNTYEWDIDMRNMRAPGRIAFLIDQFTGSRARLNLEGNSYYRFATTSNSASTAADRFLIVFNEPKKLSLEFTHTSGKRTEERIDIAWKVNNESGYWKYEVERLNDKSDFEKIHQNNQPASGTGISSYSFTDNNPLKKDNIYRIKASDAFGSAVYSEKIMVCDRTTDGLFSIRPNPITGTTVNLVFSDAVPGDHTVEITDIEGKKVMIQKINLTGSRQEVRLELEKTISSGTYFISVTGNTKNKNSTKKLIIF